ncbi:membrane protein insertase YidC [Alcaligenes sp. SMD-FA]|jgi:YidC/Oxa1 family membrane protein insertase|uniref:membrane protein insertase YidC n=1 Tax=Alcaligenes sp. SMD-FA TaxID=2991054 RepID=UPI0022269AA7|nr:membrane protein insertase YidC [Alcaligenes sp. SMD-FA]UYY87332.1 membrane protein insertase YidC [Alcaligenes sp. SMD-FA]
MDIRRTILWMIFSFALLLLWNNWQEYNGKPSLFASTPATTQAPAASDEPAANGGVPAAQEPTASAALPSSNSAVSATAQTIDITTDVYKLGFSTEGAQLIKAELLKYGSPENPEQPMVLLDNSPASTYLAQSGIVGAAGQNLPNHLTPFTLVSSQHNMTGDTLDVVFEATSDDVKVTKTYTLHKGRYDIQVRHDIQNNTGSAIDPRLYLQLTRDGNNPPDSSRLYSTFTGPVVYSSGEKFQKITFSDIDKNKATYARSVDNGWIGMVQHYFATAWVPAQDLQRTNEILKLGNNLYAVRTLESVGSIAAGQSKEVDAALWVGPQDQKAMSQLATGLDLVVDYGWLTIISKPLFKLLTWLHSLLGNWGWAIVALTVLIKLVFFPLSAASYRSMAKMKQFAPRMQALREKFGDDKAKLNAAMMEMYRTEKINPLGGCLPMLVQIPVFIALYWVLLGSVEMRGAPWILWIHDLAARDPWMILPAIMMGTMFLQIKLNPTPPDPMQAKVMMLMPLVFGGMMFFFPAGLVLYWCVNNILSIAQQRYIMVQIEKKSAKAANS